MFAMLDVCLAGTAGMVPLKDRWLSTLYLTNDGHSVLIDCGEGTQVALSAAHLRVRTIDAILITHFHLDHIGGIAGLLLAMGNAGRTEPVHIVGPRGTAEVLQHLLVVSPPPFQLIAYETAGSAQPESEPILNIGELEIRAFPLKHIIPCIGYALSLPRRPRFNPDKARALEVPLTAWSVLQKGEPVKINDRIVSPEDVNDGPRPGLRVVFATDTRPTPVITAYAEDADLLVLEGNYGDDEKIENAKKWGHMTFREAAEIARDAGVRRLWLTHFSQAMSDPADYRSHAADVFPDVELGYDGKRAELSFRD